MYVLPLDNDEEFDVMQKEPNFLPLKQKFVSNDTVLFYKIVKSMVEIQMPKDFVIYRI